MKQQERRESLGRQGGLQGSGHAPVRAGGFPLWLAAGLIAFPLWVGAAEERSEADQTPTVDAAPISAKIVYHPPRRGAPRGTVGGGVRSAAKAPPIPVALAPDHVAETTSRAPSLFWYIDGPPDAFQVRFALTREDRIDPVVEAELVPPRGAGLQRLRLSDFRVELEPEVEYEWSIAVVPDMDRRSQDRLTFGYIRRVQSASMGKDTTAAQYAKLGYWYDALEQVSDAVDAAPDDPAPRRARLGLLRQAENLKHLSME